MTPMCNTTTGVHVGWAVGVADCASDIAIQYFNTSGVSQGLTLPLTWKPCVQGEDGPEWAPTYAALTYAASVNIDFATDEYKSVVLTGNIAFTGTNYAQAREIVVMVHNSGVVSRTITIDSDWVVVGSAAPTALAAGKKAILRLIALGATDTTVVATWQVQV